MHIRTLQNNQSSICDSCWREGGGKERDTCQSTNINYNSDVGPVLDYLLSLATIFCRLYQQLFFNVIGCLRSDLHRHTQMSLLAKKRSAC